MPHPVYPAKNTGYELPSIPTSLDKLAEIIRPIITPREAVADGWHKLADAIEYAMTFANEKHKGLSTDFFQILRSIDIVANKIANAPEKSASVAVPIDHLNFLSEQGNEYLKKVHDFLSRYKYDPEQFPQMPPNSPAGILNHHVEILEKALDRFKEDLLTDADLDRHFSDPLNSQGLIL